MAKTVGQVLKAIREDAGMSRSALARALKMEPGALFRVENGASPSFETVVKVAKALGVTLEEIAAATYGRALRPKAELEGAHLAEGLDRLEGVLSEGSRLIAAMRAGRSVSPPRKRRPT